MSDAHFLECRRQVEENDPPVAINQVWVAQDEKGRFLRKIRILAQHPDVTVQNGRMWIYEEQEGLMNKLGTKHLGICPEFNLRYVFKRYEHG